MIEETDARKILHAMRGMMSTDQEKLVEIMERVGQIGLNRPAVKEDVVNPLIIAGSDPTAVNALIVVS